MTDRAKLRKAGLDAYFAFWLIKKKWNIWAIKKTNNCILIELYQGDKKQNYPTIMTITVYSSSNIILKNSYQYIKGREYLFR